jgi:hypothetical protein
MKGSKPFQVPQTLLVFNVVSVFWGVMYMCAKGCNAGAKSSKSDPDIGIDITSLDKVLEAEDIHDASGDDIHSYKMKILKTAYKDIKEKRQKMGQNSLQRALERVKKDQAAREAAMKGSNSGNA